MLDNTKHFQFDLKERRNPDKNMPNIMHKLKII